MTTPTSNYKFPKPIVGADAGQWGTELNTCLDMIDATFPLPGVLTANTLILNNNPGTGIVASLTFGNSTAAPGQQTRWAWVEDASSETGSAAGSNLSLRAYNDSGAPLSTPIAISRASGLVTFNSTPSATFVGLATFNTLTATGAATFSGAVTFSAAATFVNLTASGTVTGANVTATGVLHSNSTLTVAGASSLNGGATVSGGLTVAGGLNVTTGLATFSGGVNGATSFNSNISAVNISAGGNVNAGASVTTPDLGLPVNGAISCPSGASITCDSAGNWFMTLGGSSNFVVNNNNAFKPGGGAWGTLSDERIKTVTGEYEAGLDEVLQLRPVTYTYKGNDTPTIGGMSQHHHAAQSGKEFVGFVAQELEQIMPGMVSQGDGFIDGRRVHDLRSVDTTELVFALVNCVKRLKAEIEELKAR